MQYKRHCSPTHEPPHPHCQHHQYTPNTSTVSLTTKCMSGWTCSHTQQPVQPWCWPQGLKALSLLDRYWNSASHVLLFLPLCRRQASMQDLARWMHCSASRASATEW